MMITGTYHGRSVTAERERHGGRNANGTAQVERMSWTLRYADIPYDRNAPYLTWVTPPTRFACNRTVPVWRNAAEVREWLAYEEDRYQKHLTRLTSPEGRNRLRAVAE